MSVLFYPVWLLRHDQKLRHKLIWKVACACSWQYICWIRVVVRNNVDQQQIFLPKTEVSNKCNQMRAKLISTRVCNTIALLRYGFKIKSKLKVSPRNKLTCYSWRIRHYNPADSRHSRHNPSKWISCWHLQATPHRSHCSQSPESTMNACGTTWYSVT